MSKSLIIACDGEAASGKSTGAKLLSKKYNLLLLNSGLLYRYASKILIAKKGEILNPFQIDKWWVILRVEDKIEAKLDDTQRSKITLSLFDKWVSILTINSLKKLIDNTTAEAI